MDDELIMKKLFNRGNDPPEKFIAFGMNLMAERDKTKLARIHRILDDEEARLKESGAKNSNLLIIERMRKAIG